MYFSEDGSIEPGFKILLSIYLGYFVAVFYHLIVLQLWPRSQYSYFILTSMALYYWNFGTDLLHPIITITVQWLLLKAFKGSRKCVLLSFIFQMGYYLIGIWIQEPNYKLNWLTPQCVLLLRMIGLAFDTYDGQRDQEKLSPDQKERGLTSCPSYTEILAYSFFPGGFLIGPQFPLVHLRKLVSKQLIPVTVSNLGRYKEALCQLTIGTVILVSQQHLQSYISFDYLTTFEFKSSAFFKKMVMICVCGHLGIIKYLAIWSINDGVCIITGLGYRGSKDSPYVWDAVRNSKLSDFITCYRYQHIVSCYNINTNGWVLRYVHKRLRFVGSRLFSHFCSLLFLAIWHGFHVGYFTAFALQLLVMNAERQFLDAVSRTPAIMMIVKLMPTWLPKLIGSIYLHAFLGYCFVDFALMHWSVFSSVNGSVYWCGHWFFILLLITAKFLSRFCAVSSDVNLKISAEPAAGEQQKLKAQ